MCGGPVIVRRSTLSESQLEILDKEQPFQRSAAHQYLPPSYADKRYICGMIDGITSSTVEEDLRDKVSIIEAKDIDRFI